MKHKPTIIDCINDPDTFGNFLGTNHRSWGNWLTVLKVIYGLKLTKAEADFVHQRTGRDPSRLPKSGFSIVELIAGRRSGKSRISAIIGAYEALFAGHETKLAKGETGVVAILSPTRDQSQVIFNYLKGIFDAPLLRAEVVREGTTSFELANGLVIETLTGEHRSVRGRTLVCAIVDEGCFFGLAGDDSLTKAKSDKELVNGILPALATTHGKLIFSSSPYAERGWGWETYKSHYGQDDSPVCVWNGPSLVMNPTLDRVIVDAAYINDLASAKAEYGAEFRSDVAVFITAAVLDPLIMTGIRELLPREQVSYSAFADCSGGRSDDASLCIGHREGRKVVIDVLKRFRPPHNPYQVIGEMAHTCREYFIRRVVTDNYAANFATNAFTSYGLMQHRSEKPKSVLFLELLPRLCSGEIALPDDPVLYRQLLSLERKTRSGGNDSISKPPGGHDDLANAVAGLADLIGKPAIPAGGYFSLADRRATELNNGITVTTQADLLSRRMRLARLVTSPQTMRRSWL